MKRLWSRSLSASQRKKIAERQRNKCANQPGSHLAWIESYECQLWRGRNGKFDLASYEVDHIIPFAVSGDNSDENLQALCALCHRVKTANQKQDKILIAAAAAFARRSGFRKSIRGKIKTTKRKRVRFTTHDGRRISFTAWA